MNVRARWSVWPAVLAVLIVSGSAPESGSALERKIPESHPIALTAMPTCTECHPDDTGVALKPIATFNHSADFFRNHRFYSPQTYGLCNACHKPSFCADCHAYKDELKPSEKYSGSPERWLPHRGDYLFQHRIDGKVDPMSCYRCHGTQNNRTCKRCHK
jgi:hypothetical protein